MLTAWNTSELGGEWAQLALEATDVDGVECLRYSDRAKARLKPLPRSVADLMRKILEEKWTEGWSSGIWQNYNRQSEQRADWIAASSSNWLSPRFYQLKT